MYVLCSLLFSPTLTSPIDGVAVIARAQRHIIDDIANRAGEFV
jgi:hypothetical protein